MKRKKLLRIGFLLIFVGFCLWGASFKKDVREVDEPAGEVSKKSWVAFGNFTGGDVMYISMTQGLNWPKLVDPDPHGYKWVYLNLSDPDDGYILFEVEYVIRAGTEPGPPLNPTYVRITENGSKCLHLLWEDKTNLSGGVFIVGEVLVGGKYKVEVVDFFPPAGDEDPPASLQLRRKWLKYVYPCSFLLYLGIIFIILGLLIIVLAVRSKKRS